MSRLVSIGRLLFVWYGVASVAFAVLVGVAGFWFLERPGSAIHWQQPWLSVVMLSAMLLWTLPFNALLEGLLCQFFGVFGFAVDYGLG